MKLGILGGTFDPIHFGHILMAQAALDEMALDRVLLLPGGDPPLKLLSPQGGRLHMVRRLRDTDERFGYRYGAEAAAAPTPWIRHCS